MLVFALLLLGRAPAGADEPLATERVVVEMVPSKEAVYVGERFTLTLEVRYDEAWFAAHATALFQQRLDVPVQVEAVALRAVEGSRALAAPPPGTDAPRTLVLNDALTALPSGDLQRAGPTWRVLSHSAAFVATRAGTLTIPAPALTFAWADRFEESLLQGRVPVAARRERIDGRRLSLTVLPLPEEGRPAGFSGAVGRYTLEASVDRSAVGFGEAFRLTVTLRGDGDLDAPTLPRLDGVAGLHVYGALPTRAADSRSVLYEVAVVPPGTREIPALSFSFFDPTPPAAYRFVTTAPIPLQVRAPPARPTALPAAPPATTRLLVPALAVATLLALAALAWRRRRRRRAAPSRTRTLDTALAHLRTSAPQGGAPAADALADVLAAHLGCRREAVLAPGLGPRLCAAGVPEPLAVRAADILERLVSERYGAPAHASTTPAALETLASDLTRALDEPG